MDFSQNYFDLFQLDVGFEVDRVALDSAYRALQREYHPDRHAHKGDAAQREAVQVSTLLNTAYESLKDPLLRAQYLLSLKGIDTGEDSRRQLPVEFLVEQMELRESLADAPDAADPFETLAQLDKQASASQSECFMMFKSALISSDFEVAEVAVRKLQFFKKLLSEIESMEERLEGELN